MIDAEMEERESHFKGAVIYRRTMTTPSSSRELLESVLQDLADANDLLKAGSTTGTNVQQVKKVEFESLKFEESAEAARFRALNLTEKLTTVVSTQPGKMALKNLNLWSSRSVAAEQLLRPLVTASVNSWPDYELISRIASASDEQTDLLNKLNMSVVDTLMVRLTEATEVRFGIDRISSPWSFGNEKFELTKIWHDKIELDIVVLSLINDHYAHLQYKKDQERVAQEMKLARKSNKPISVVVPLSSPAVVRASGAVGRNRKVLAESECRTHALLKAVCKDGSAHIRPLCTSGDVLLALHELLDPSIFLHGNVQLQHPLSDAFQRHTDGYYRYTYQAIGPGKWQYFRTNLPAPLSSLQPYVHPGTVDHKVAFTVQTLPMAVVPQRLRQASAVVVKQACQLHGKRHTLQRLVVDFEACLETASWGSSPSPTAPQVPASGSTGQPTAVAAAGGSQVPAWTAGQPVIAPHLVPGLNSTDIRYHFRVLHVAESQFERTLIGQRRDAVCSLAPDVKMYLRNFDAYFYDEWELLRRERNRQDVEAFMHSRATTVVTAGSSTGEAASEHSVMVASHTKLAGSPTKTGRNAGNTGGQFIVEVFGNTGGKQRHGKGGSQSSKKFDSDAAKTDAKELARRLFDAQQLHRQQQQQRERGERSGKRRRGPLSRSRTPTQATIAEEGSGSSDDSDSDGLRSAQPLGGVAGYKGGSDDGGDSDEEEDCGSDDGGERPLDPLRDTIFHFKSYKQSLQEPQPAVSDHGGTAPEGGVFLRRAGGTFMVRNHRQTAIPQPAELQVEGHGATTGPTTAPTAGTGVPASPLPTTEASPTGTTRKRMTRMSVLGSSSSPTAAQGRRRSTHRNSVIGNPDQNILARYHITESKRVETERKKAEEDRIARETAERLAKEKAEQDRRRQSSMYSLYFVTRTFIKRPDQASAKHAAEQEAAAELAAAMEEAEQDALAAGGGTRNAYIVQSQANRAMAATLARNTRRAGRRGATQALNIANMTDTDAQLVYQEDQRKYRQVMDDAATDVVQYALQRAQKQSKARSTTTQATTATARGGDQPAVLIDKELYLAVDHLLRSEDSPTRGRRTERALSPSKMYEEMNKLPPTAGDAEGETLKPRIRNDEEFNQKAYKLAERLDLSYLVTQFNPANHTRGKDIILDEDCHSGRASPSPRSPRSPHIEIGSGASDVDSTGGLPGANDNAAQSQGTEEPNREPTEVEKKARAAEYAAYMKRIYEEEMQVMEDSLIDRLPDKLATKVRKALAARQHQLKMKRRRAYILRRRKIEKLQNEELDKLKHFYENQQFVPGDDLTDSGSSDDEAAERANQTQMDTLLGELAGVTEEQMAAMVEARAAEEAAELAAQEAAEARRLEKEEEQARRKEARAKAKAEAAADAELAGSADGTAGEAPGGSTDDAARRGSVAQVRRSIRTFSLMRLTKVLLDGTLVPQPVEPRHGSAGTSDGGISRLGTADTTAGTATDGGSSDAEGTDRASTAATSSRPVTGVSARPLPVFSDDDDEEIDTQTSEAAGLEPEARRDSMSSPRVQFSRPSTRSAMWDLPPLTRSAPSTPAAGPRPALVSVAEGLTADGDDVENGSLASMAAMEGTHGGDSLPTGGFGTGYAIAAGDPGLGDQQEIGPGPESGSAFSSTTDLEVASLLKELTIRRKPSTPGGHDAPTAVTAATPPTDAFVHRRAPRSASFAHGTLSMGVGGTSGSPQVGLPFNMVKASEQAMQQGVDRALARGRLSTVKGLPVLGRPSPQGPTSAGPKKKPAKPQPPPPPPPQSESKHAAPTTATDPTASASNNQDSVDPATLGKSRGLYLIPGRDVSSLAQRPSADKPARPIVYTTRVVVQQKLREFINAPEQMEYMEIPKPGAAQYRHSQRIYIQPPPLATAPSITSEAGTSVRLSPITVPTTSQYGPVGVLFCDSVRANEGSTCSVPDSGDLSDNVSDFQYTERKLSSPGRQPIYGDAEQARTHHPVNPEEGRIEGELSAGEDSGGEGIGLELSEVEWTQILHAAREEALLMNLDIVKDDQDLNPETGAGQDPRQLSAVHTPYVEALPSVALPLGDVEDPVSVIDFLQAQLGHPSELLLFPGPDGRKPFTVQQLLGTDRSGRAGGDLQPVPRESAVDSKSHLAHLLAEESAWHPSGRPKSAAETVPAHGARTDFDDIAARLQTSYGIPDVRGSDALADKAKHRPTSPHTSLKSVSAASPQHRVSPPRTRPVAVHSTSAAHHSDDTAPPPGTESQAHFLVQGVHPPLAHAQASLPAQGTAQGRQQLPMLNSPGGSGKTAPRLRSDLRVALPMTTTLPQDIAEPSETSDGGEHAAAHLPV